MLNFKSLGDEGLNLVKNMLPTKNTCFNRGLNSDRQILYSIRICSGYIIN
jgi:hypothetical protein